MEEHHFSASTTTATGYKISTQRTGELFQADIYTEASPGTTLDPPTESSKIYGGPKSQDTDRSVIKVSPPVLDHEPEHYVGYENV